MAELADRHGLALEDDEDEPVDLDGLDHLLELPASEEICNQLLNAWNLYGDIARSLEVTLGDDGEKAHRCYDKLLFTMERQARVLLVNTKMLNRSVFTKYLACFMPPSHPAYRRSPLLTVR